MVVTDGVARQPVWTWELVVVHEVDVESIDLQETHSSVTVAVSVQSSSLSSGSSSGSSLGPELGFGRGLGSLEAEYPPPPQATRQGPWQKDLQAVSHLARLVQDGPFLLSEALV